MIYLDYNATTPLSPEAREAMLPYLDSVYGNPSSLHSAGRAARAAVDDSRDRIASILKVRPNEIVFTGGGTESNNLALLGLARPLAGKGKHIISTQTEHNAVRRTVQQLEREGFSITWADVQNSGVVDLDRLRDSIRPDTILVSIMAANNETGVIQPLAEISEICRQRGVLLHSDMVQAFGKMEIDLGLVDAASFAAHKIYGPKGTGFLFLRSGLPIQTIMYGGSHENQRRPGTENVAGIVGLAEAAATLPNDPAELARVATLRDRLWAGIKKSWPNALLNGAEAPRLPNTLNVVFNAMDSQTLLIAFDLEGLCASSGSACMVGSVTPSHVLLAMGLTAEQAASAVRFSLGHQTTEKEIDCAIAILEKLARRWQDRLNLPQGHALAAAAT
jgi:cysteine desulfurase